MKKVTVKAIREWMKTLEENRYRKIVNADARRIAWFVNNSLSEDYDTMPESMRKKWVKAEYKKERYMAKKFLESQKQNESVENKVRHIIREILSESFKDEPMIQSMKDIPQEKQLNLKKWYKLGFTKKEILDMFKKKQKKGELNLESILKSLNEEKRVQLILPARERKRVDVLLKKLKLKSGIDFDYGVGKGTTFIIDLDKKYYNKVLELFISKDIQVRR